MNRTELRRLTKAKARRWLRSTNRWWRVGRRLTGTADEILTSEQVIEHMKPLFSACRRT